VLLLDNSRLDGNAPIACASSRKRCRRVGRPNASIQTPSASSTFRAPTGATLRVDGRARRITAAAAAAELPSLTPGRRQRNLGDALGSRVRKPPCIITLGEWRQSASCCSRMARANLRRCESQLRLKQKVEGPTAKPRQSRSNCFRHPGLGKITMTILLEVLNAQTAMGRLMGFINTPGGSDPRNVVAQNRRRTAMSPRSDVKSAGRIQFQARHVVIAQIGYAKHQLTKEQFPPIKTRWTPPKLPRRKPATRLLTRLRRIRRGEGSNRHRARCATKVSRHRRISRAGRGTFLTPGSAVALEQASPAHAPGHDGRVRFSEWLATSPFAGEVTTDQLLQ